MSGSSLSGSPTTGPDTEEAFGLGTLLQCEETAGLSFPFSDPRKRRESVVSGLTRVCH